MDAMELLTGDRMSLEQERDTLREYIAAQERLIKKYEKKGVRPEIIIQANEGLSYLWSQYSKVLGMLSNR